MSEAEKMIDVMKRFKAFAATCPNCPDKLKEHIGGMVAMFFAAKAVEDNNLDKRATIN